MQDLIDRLQKGPYQEQYNAARQLGEIGDDNAIEPLIAELGNSHSRVKRQALQSLGKIGARSEDPVRRRQVLSFLSEKLRSHQGLAEAAAQGVAAFGAEALPDLMLRLSDGEPTSLQAAASAIAQVGLPALEILERMLEHPNAKVRKTGMDGLIRLLWGDSRDRAMAALRSALANPDVALRANAASHLGLNRDPVCVPQLVAALGDQSLEVRGQAALALGHIGSRDALQPLITALTDAPILKQVVYALGELGDSEALAPLRTYLNTADDKLGFLLLLGLARCGDETGIEKISKVCAADEDVERVMSAIDALGAAAVKHPECAGRVVSILTARLGDPRAPRSAALNHLAVGNTVNHRVRRALEEIGTPGALAALKAR